MEAYDSHKSLAHPEFDIPWVAISRVVEGIPEESYTTSELNNISVGNGSYGLLVQNKFRKASQLSRCTQLSSFKDPPKRPTKSHWPLKKKDGARAGQFITLNSSIRLNYHYQ